MNEKLLKTIVKGCKIVFFAPLIAVSLFMSILMMFGPSLGYLTNGEALFLSMLFAFCFFGTLFYVCSED